MELVLELVNRTWKVFEEHDFRRTLDFFKGIVGRNLKFTGGSSDSSERKELQRKLFFS